MHIMGRDVTDFNKSAFIYNEVQDLMCKLGYAVNPHIHKENPALQGGTQKEEKEAK
jgi:hypothetical protein